MLPSLITTQCQACRLDADGACRATSKHSRTKSRGTGLVRSSRLRTQRVVVSSAPGDRGSGGMAHDRSRSPACRCVWEHGPVKIMFASLGAYGHLYPMMPLALAGAAPGHETVIAAGPPFLGRLPLPTVSGYPPELELDWAIQEARRRHPDLHDQEFSMAMSPGVPPESVAPTMIKQWEQLRPDLVIYEGMDTGAGVAASVLGIPAAAYAIALASVVYSPLHRSTVSYQRDMWLQRDRTPPDEV